jgi:CRISPR-associated endonuclease/helicase Cas3
LDPFFVVHILPPETPLENNGTDLPSGPDARVENNGTKVVSTRIGEDGNVGDAPVTCEPFRLLWAKSRPRHALWKHLLDAAAVSLALPPLPGSAGLSQAEVALFVGLHDVGKASPQFQHMVAELSVELAQAGFPKTADAECRHERLSAMFVRGLLEDHLGGRRAGAVALAVAAHHGRWDDDAFVIGEQYRRAQGDLCALLCDCLQVDELPEALAGNVSAFGMMLAGRVVLCDWIASNEEFLLDERLQGIDQPEEYFQVAGRVARDWVMKLGFDSLPRPGRPERIVDDPRPLQQTLLAEDIPPGLVIIEAPMGEGKTEAAWILAEKWRREGCHGMYMALPTMATSDSLHDRYRRGYLGRIEDSQQVGRQVKLVHGMAWLRDLDEPESEPVVGDTADDRSAAAAWFRPTRRAMLSAHGVGTVDQVMLAAMNAKFGFLRLYGLAGRALVIDEVHAYDAYMTTIIARLLKWCAALQIPVVLLSATLSSAQRKSLAAAYGADVDGDADTGGTAGDTLLYPLVTVARSDGSVMAIPAEASVKRVLRVECLPGALGDADSTAAKAAALVENGGCCCVIVNTVRQAQTVYQALALPEGEKMLFHARFTALDRSRIADRVTSLFGKDRASRPVRCVLVATQVVEQSLDVDFDHMVSEIAPIDLLLQRSGRLHRHVPRDHEPTLHVLVPEKGVLDFGGSGRVYARKPLLRTLAMLAGVDPCCLHLPNDFRPLIERCYGATEWEQDWVPWEVVQDADKEWETETRLLESRARPFLLQEPWKDGFRPVDNDPVGDDSDDGNGWRASTRIGANDRTALLVPEADVSALAAGDMPMDQVRELYQQSVRLPGYLPVTSPADGYRSGVQGGGRLRGLLLLPMDNEGTWKGVDEKGGCLEVRYDNTLGLVVGRPS